MFNATDLLYIFIEDRNNALKLEKMSKKLKFEGESVELAPKNCLFRQSRIKYLEQNTEIQ